MNQSRVLSLDVLRGFALFGILFGNLTWFTGWAVLSGDERAALATAPIDSIVSWMIHFLVDGKFYGVFSLLFGAGLTILAQRAIERGEAPGPLLLRRLLLLLLLGLAHAVFLWFGDIVSLYALFGLALIPFARVPDRQLLKWSLAMLAVPVVVAAVWLALPAGEGGYGPGYLLPAFGSGSYREAFEANWAFLSERWFLALFSGRPFKLIGLFLLGVWAVKAGLALEPERHRAKIRRLSVWGLGLGIPANIVLAFLITYVPDRPPSFPGFLRATVDACAAPTLAIGYAATLLLLLDQERWRQRLAWLAAPGRMTLTNYFAQSVIGVALFYGCGLGWWGRFGAVWIVAFAVGIFLLQAALSTLWLRHYRQGPLEWLWRTLTYSALQRRSSCET